MTSRSLVRMLALVLVGSMIAACGGLRLPATRLPWPTPPPQPWR